MLAVCRNTNLECEKVEGTEDGGSKRERERDENTGLKQGQHADSVCSSCLHKEEQERRCLADQVQGQMPEEPLHPCPQGHRQGRQAEAVAPTGYVKIFLQEQERERGRTIILI